MSKKTTGKQIVVIKLGSGSVTKAANMNLSIMAKVLQQAIQFVRKGWGVILVSSGARAMGETVLNGMTINKSKDYCSPELASSFGQPVLMDFYKSLSGIQLIQILLGKNDLLSREKMTIVASTIQEALPHGIIPIINGNDPIDVDKTNNDLIATGIAVMIGATHLFFLTDVSGVYREELLLNQLHVSDIHTIKSNGAGVGTGGIKSKLKAAEVAAKNGIQVNIVNVDDFSIGHFDKNNEKAGTEILSNISNRYSDSDKWISGGAIAQGTLTINLEAERSIVDGNSLFASGVKRISGNFAQGDVVEIRSPRGKLLGRGACNLSSELLRLIRASSIEYINNSLMLILTRAAKIPVGSGTLDSKLNNVNTCIDALSVESKQALFREVIGLFPDFTAKAMIRFIEHKNDYPATAGGNTGIQTTGEDNELDYSFKDLVSRLTIVHNDDLIVFE
ncbi:MAG: glutamate 5-kinase [Clostridiales Family XIII bacterium]|jgi:glutamate 5-kinase|nr:glutamate 5-kinase [Clostridiales Family XIII bacterium]